MHEASVTLPPLPDAVMHCPAFEMWPVVLLYAQVLMLGMSEQLKIVHSPCQFSTQQGALLPTQVVSLSWSCWSW